MKKILILVFLLCISSTFLFSNNVYAQSDFQREENNDVILAIDGDKYTPSFEEVANQTNPKWFIFGPTLAQAENDFEHISLDEVYKAYRNTGIQDYPINEEKYGLFGTDSTNTEVQLEPVDSIYSANNINASGSVSIKIKTVSIFPSADYIARYNDSMRLKNMHTDIRIVGESTKVGYGKILVRTTTTSTWGDWSFYDLEDFTDDDNLSLSFSAGKKVQIVVIYEVKEKADSIFHPHKYYRIRGVYRFNTV